MSLFDKVKRAYNAFTNARDPTDDPGTITYSYRPDRVRFSRGNERTIVTSIFNRIAMDAAEIDILHVKMDDENRYVETIKSDLNNCLTSSANIDQTGRAFRQDVYMSMLDEGCIAIVPVDTDKDPRYTDSYKIYTMRTAKIVQWSPTSVKVRLYNERTGRKEDIWLNKTDVAIIENPLYSVINEHNSTIQRLVRKLNLLDAIDEQSSSGKLDLIIQLPYQVRSKTRRDQAEKRRQDIVEQLTGSKYGIAYTDGTEKITQLNRPVENNLLKQIEYLTDMAYGQLGMTKELLNGTANESTMMNYYIRTIEPMVANVVDELKRKFLTKTAISQRQSIIFLRDPFKLVPITALADIADTFTRNEILSSNEIRQIVGRKPINDPKADQLVNSNLNHPEATPPESTPMVEEPMNSEEETSIGDTPVSAINNEGG